MEEDLLQERLLDAWLKLSSVISNDRLVSGFSFNEALVLNLLYKQYCGGKAEKLTATALCARTRILKSQMNGILNSLEKKELIIRKRSCSDRRQIEVEMNPEYLNEFIECHTRSLNLVERLVQKVGEETASQGAELLSRLADGFTEVLAEASAKSGEKIL